MFKLTPDITKDWIRERVSDEEIFSYYLGIEVRLNCLFKSPLRDDHHPTCSFYISRSGVLRLTDFSGHFAGDCFNLVEFMYSVNFYQTLKIIASDFNLIDKNIDKKSIEYVRKTPQGKSKISLMTKPWTNTDREFWGQYKINEDLLNYYNVYSVRAVYTNDKLVYSYHMQNPAYGYVFGENDMKIYFPLAKKNIQPKFIGNTNVLQGYSQLPQEGKYLVITKSLKDVMVLYNFGIPAIAPQSESQILSDEQYAEFSERFDYIYSLYDFDYVGVKSANKMKKEYGIKPLFLTNGRFKSFDYGAKDVSDYVSYMGDSFKGTQACKRNPKEWVEYFKSQTQSITKIQTDIAEDSDGGVPF
jgi:hypothetical protein